MSAAGENPGALEWAAARGDKWSRYVSPLEATLRPVDAPLIDALALAQPSAIADIGCGGGGTTLEISRRAPRGSIVHGYDISPQLVQRARAHAIFEQRAVTFEVADVATSLPPVPYTRLVSRFGTMFFDDPPGAFRNLAQWLAPGGRFAFAVWGSRDDNVWQTAVRDAVAGVVALPEVDPDAPGPFRYAQSEKLLELLKACGFAQLEARRISCELPIGGNVPAAEAARFGLAAFSSFGELLSRAGAEAEREAERLLTQRLTEYERDGSVWMRAGVHLLTGTRR